MADVGKQLRRSLGASLAKQAENGTPSLALQAAVAAASRRRRHSIYKAADVLEVAGINGESSHTEITANLHKVQRAMADARKRHRRSIVMAVDGISNPSSAPADVSGAVASASTEQNPTQQAVHRQIQQAVHAAYQATYHRRIRGVVGICDAAAFTGYLAMQAPMTASDAGLEQRMAHTVANVSANGYAHSTGQPREMSHVGGLDGYGAVRPRFGIDRRETPVDQYVTNCFADGTTSCEQPATPWYLHSRIRLGGI